MPRRSKAHAPKANQPNAPQPEAKIGAPGELDPWNEEADILPPPPVGPYCWINLSLVMDGQLDRAYSNFVTQNLGFTYRARLGQFEFTSDTTSSTGRASYYQGITRSSAGAIGYCSCYANREKRLLCKHLAAAYLYALIDLHKEGRHARKVSLFLTNTPDMALFNEELLRI